MSAKDTSKQLETRKRILKAAEELFALRGFDATSIRDITESARCNIASVNYHFGGKDKLYAETAHEMVGDLREKRIRQLREDLDSFEDPLLEDFLRSFAQSFLEENSEHPENRYFMLFFAREMIDPHLPPRLFFEEFIRPLMEFTIPILLRLSPGLGQGEAALCMMSLVAQLHHQLRIKKQLADEDATQLLGEKRDDFIDHIVRFSAAGIRACSKKPRDKDR